MILDNNSFKDHTNYVSWASLSTEGKYREDRTESERQ